MRYRKLRIAWSVVFGGLALLLTALWVRSYWWIDGLSIPHSGNRYLSMGTAPGTIGANDYAGGSSTFVPWHHSSISTDEWLKLVQQNKLFKVSRVWGRFYFAKSGFSVPDWFALIFLTTIASLPWLRYTPNRFSLRTLLIATTLVAVVLGAIMWLSE
jgi:hypothetical protein